MNSHFFNNSLDIQTSASFSEEVFVLPTSFAQQRLWFLDQFESDNSFYNLPAAVQLKGQVNIPVLEKSFQEIVRRHEVLRTGFTLEDGEPVQVIYPNVDLKLQIVDFTRIQNPNSQIQTAILEEAQKPFNLAEPPLLRTTLIKLDEQEFILLLNIHHIVSDGWSLGVLVKELAALYEAFLLNKPSPLPDLPIQYADFAIWQQENLQGEKLETQLNYWKQQLKDAPLLLELPVDKPRPAVQTFRGARQSFVLSKVLTENLKEFSNRENATVFMTLLAAFKVLLYRYTDRTDILVGSPIANRNKAEIEGLIGFFVNTLILRTQLSESSTFRELLAQVREVTLGAYAHQDLPFEKLVEELKPERSLSHNPLFQVMFLLQNAPMPTLELSGLTLSVLEIDSSTSKFDLTLEMAEKPDGLHGWFEYNTDLFESGTISRMIGHFETLLEGLVTNPDRKLSHLPLLTENEQHQLLVEWVGNQEEINDREQHLCLHQLFEAQVERTPDAVALVFEDQQLTYRELNEKANSLANYLQTLGVKPEVLVGICVERSLEMLIGLLGILKAGGAYVPLDPAYPSERLAFMLEDAEVPVLLTQSHLVETLPKHQAGGTNILPITVCLDTQWQTNNLSQENPVSGVAAENRAYVIYTSGSTGKPKGVQICHQAVVNFLSSMRLTPGLTGEDTLLSVTTLSFDIAALELFLPLSAGARVVLVSRQVASDGKLLLETLYQSRATVMQATPATWRLLLEAGWSGSGQLKILCGGEALPRELANQLTARCQELWNLYGPTETTIWSAACKVKPGNASVPIGKPIANTQIYLLDRHLVPVPIGVPGEVYIGGAGLARGYLNRPDLTAEKFIANPFSNERNSRLYKTGDLGRYLPDGTIEYLGRIDNQVKLRGFRIEPGEIEAKLLENPAVREAVVVVREESLGNKRLVAYVVPQKQSIHPKSSELRDNLQQKLPNYMVPATFVMLESLPLTPNGKVDRKALPAPDTSKHELASNFISPRNPVEEVIAGIWTEVLHVERVSIHDNFFELGGHSLLATQVISRLREAFQIAIPLSWLFESPAVASLSIRIETALKSEQKFAAPPIHPVPRNQTLPLSFAQQRMWFLQQLEPDSSLYNFPVALRLKGALNVAALEQSFNEIIQRHEALRTSFVEMKGELAQIIHGTATITLPVIDLSEVPASNRDAEVRRLAIEDAGKPFNLTQCSLLRATLLRLNSQEHITLLTMHHIVSDGWSMEVFLKELAALYEAFYAGNPSPLPELPIQYPDFATWQREWLQGEVLEKQMGYWRKQLAGTLPVLELPADRPRPAVQTFQGAQESFVVPKTLTEAIAKLSRREGTTLFMTLLAAFKVLLYRYTGQTDILIGSPIANRNRAEIEKLIGFFVNTLVLRTDLASNPTFRELLSRVREVALGAYAHQDLPFEKLVEELQPARNMSHAPLFQVMFVLQNSPISSLKLPGLTLHPFEIETTTAKFDLTLSMLNTEQGLNGVVEYNIDLFDAATIKRLIGHFQTLLEGIVANPVQRISELPLLTSAERQQILIEWNNTQTDYPHDKCVHQLFEAQVERTPDAVAAVFQDKQLTYRQLNAKANQLAHYLRSLGVKPDGLVGICALRSLDMMVGILAILKAGGAYVPLDPAYPSERLALMLQDAQVPVLLTQERLLETLPNTSAQIVCLDNWDNLNIQGKDLISTQVNSSNLAYVIYTSGSTGTPKGVAIEHKSTVSLLNWAKSVFTPEELTGVLAATSICFDLSVFEIFVPLSWGGRVILAENALHLPTLEAANQVTLINTVPSAISELLRSDSIPTSVRTINLAGEPLQNALVQQLYQCPHLQKVYNLYGPSEDTTYSTFALIERNSEGIPPIGRPISKTQVYVLDKHLQPVPIGVPGEVYIGGEGLARGYYNRPDLTAERFIANPFSKEPNSRLYKTGDLARYLSDGTIEYIGRIDNQVKIRGFRIELGEIEARLVENPAVREGVVVVREESLGNKRLVAYVVPQQQSIALKASDLREDLHRTLPDYMVPTSFVILEALPLTPNGKVDRKALPAPHTTRPELEKTFTAPSTPVEKTLAQIWTQVLGLKQVGIDDNFFELGGDSILSIQVIAKAHQAGLNLTPKQLFQYQTIAQLAAVAGTTTAIESQQELVMGKFSLTPIQHWFFEQNLSDSHHWNQAILLETQQPLDSKRVEEVVRQLLRHHDALRLRFLREEIGWQQENAEPDEVVPFTPIDLSSLPAQEQELAMQKAVDNLQASLNLSQGQLMRVALFDFGGQKPNYLLFVIHHLAVDGVSWRILIEDFQTAYEQISRDEAVKLPPKTTSFKQWAESLNLYAQSEELKEELKNWLSHSGEEVSRLPVDNVKGTNTVATANTVSVSLSVEETRSLLQEVPAAYHTQINDVLLTALLQAFEDWTGKQTLLVDLEGHGREDIFEDVDLSRTVGWFTSLFPVLLNLEATHPGEALKAVKEQLRAIPNHGIGYGILRYLSGEIADKLHSLPQAEVSFNYLGQFDQLLPSSSLFTLSSNSPGITRSPQGNRTHLLEINCFVVGEKLQVDWTYSQEIHQQSTIENLAQGFKEKLRALIAHCQSPDAGGYTPSDFAEFQWSQWSQEDLDKINAVLGEV